MVGVTVLADLSSLSQSKRNGSGNDRASIGTSKFVLILFGLETGREMPTTPDMIAENSVDWTDLQDSPSGGFRALWARRGGRCSLPANTQTWHKPLRIAFTIDPDPSGAW